MNKVLLASVLVLTLTMPLQAQQEVQCASRDALVTSLTEEYGESRQAVAISSQQYIMELYANEESGTRTVTYTLPTGMMCILGHGLNYEELNETLEPNL